MDELCPGDKTATIPLWVVPSGGDTPGLQESFIDREMARRNAPAPNNAIDIQTYKAPDARLDFMF